MMENTDILEMELHMQELKSPPHQQKQIKDRYLSFLAADIVYLPIR